MLDTDAKVEFDDIALPVGQSAQGAFDFAAQGLVVVEFLVGARCAVVFKDVEQGVVFPFHKGSIHGDVAGSHPKGRFYFLRRDFQEFRQLFRRRFTFEFLL